MKCYSNWRSFKYVVNFSTFNIYDIHEGLSFRSLGKEGHRSHKHEAVFKIRDFNENAHETTYLFGKILGSINDAFPEDIETTRSSSSNLSLRCFKILTVPPLTISCLICFNGLPSICKFCRCCRSPKVFGKL